jgi:hypothetical protein
VLEDIAALDDIKGVLRQPLPDTEPAVDVQAGARSMSAGGSNRHLGRLDAGHREAEPGCRAWEARFGRAPRLVRGS